ncbi:MAG: RHS repeat-associated core domain-containing protein [Acidobacteriota bacterium]
MNATARAAVQSVRRPPVKRARPKAKPPQTLAELFKLVLKRFLISLIWQIPLAILLMLAIWALHTFTLVYVNEGFSPGGSAGFFANLFRGLLGIDLNQSLAGRGLLAILSGAVDGILATKGRGLIAGPLFWLLFMSLITGTVRRLLLHPARTIGSIATTPSWMRKTLKRASSPTAGFAFLTGGATLGLGLGVGLGSRMLALVVCLHAVNTLLLHMESFSTLVVRLGWSDAQRWAHAAVRRPLNPGYLCMGVMGLVVGSFAGAVMPFLWVCGCGGIFLLLLATVMLALLPFLGGRSASPAMRSFILCLLVAGVLMSAGSAVYADDGGWRESGGTFSQWIQSQGALIAIMLGLPASAGAALGAVLGAATAGIGDDFAGTLDITMDLPDLPGTYGGPGDNGFTVFDPGSGSPGSCSPFGLPRHYVNTATLNLVIQDTLFAYSGLGPPVALTLTYNADPSWRGMFGRGWVFSYDSALREEAGTVTLRRGSGQRLRFHLPPGPPPPQGHTIEGRTPDGKRVRLAFTEGCWVFEELAARLRYRYEPVPGTEAFRLSAVADINGNEVRLAYAPDGTLAGLTDAAGRTTRFTCDADRRCTGITVPSGGTVSLSYNASGELARAVDLAGIPSAYAYNAHGLVESMEVGKDKKTTRFVYDDLDGRLILARVTDAAGAVTRYEVAAGDPVEVRATDPEGRTTLYRSRGGFTEAVVDPLGRALQTAYDRGLPVTHVERNGAVARLEYDASGNLVRAVDALGRTTTFAYDANGDVTESTDPLGQRWHNAYDDRRNLVRIVSPSGSETRFAYDGRGLLAAAHASSGISRTFAHDRFGNPVSLTDGNGNVTLRTYDEQGLLRLSETDPSGHTTRFEYDANHRLTKLVHPDRSFAEHVFDCCAEVMTLDERGGDTQVERDPLLRVVRVTSPGGGTRRYRYDGSGNRVEETDPSGRLTSIAYDAAGQAVRIKTAQGQTVEASYGGAGNLTRWKDEGGGTTELLYDPFYRQVGTRDALGRTTSLDRDPLGRPVTLTNGRGQAVALEYDADGRVTRRLHGGTPEAEFGYDAQGRLSSVLDAQGTTRFRYAGEGAPSVVEYPTGEALRLSYDAAGRPAALAYPSGPEVRMARDNRHRVAKMEWAGHWMEFEYDAAGSLVGETRSNGTASRYAYDADGRMVEARHERKGEPFIHLRYTRDASGNVVEEAGETPLAWSEPAGAIEAAFDKAHQLTSWRSEPCRHDGDGNLTAIGSATLSAAFDAENRLTDVSLEGRASRFTYTASGLLASAEARGQVTRFVHDPWGRILAETDADGRPRVFYLYSDQALVARVSAEGAVHFYHADKMGSVLALTSEDGSLAAAYAYGPYGAVARTGEMENPFTFVGACGVLDLGGGLFAMGRRHYFAPIGRFLQRDPMGFAAGTNPYAYVGGNPQTLVDPLGTFGIDFGDWKFWAGSSLTALGGILVLAPTGVSQVLGASTMKVGIGLMVTGGTLDAYSMATAGNGIDKAQATKDQENMTKLRKNPQTGKWEIDPDVESCYTGTNRNNLLDLCNRMNAKDAVSGTCTAPK